MKLYQITVFSLFITLISCNVLDQDPQDKIDTELAFSSEGNALKAVNGLYNVLQSVYDWRLQVIGDLPSDIVQSVDTWDAFITIDEYRTTAQNSEIEDLYTILYRGIDIANNIITEVPKLQLGPDKENDMTGQAFCIRGLLYFELLRIWGGYPHVYGDKGVIIRTTPSTVADIDLQSSRSMLSEGYEQAKADLEKSLQMLPESRASNVLNRGRMIRSTAQAILARLFLYLQDYSSAVLYATAVINNSLYKLVVPYESIFKTKNSNESILEIQYGTNDISGLRNWYFPPSSGGRGGLALHEEFYNDLVKNSEDSRSKLIALRQQENLYYPTKYGTAGNVDNTHVFRIAEMFLIRAEARTHLGDLENAKADLNLIRKRAQLGETLANTKEELLEAILHENKLEFFQEGHRWFDLARTGNAESTLQNLKRRAGSLPVSMTSKDRLVFPFPASDLLTNPNLEQNKAYR